MQIQSVSIDWNKIERGSYLREIEAFKGLDQLSFHKNITIFVGENGSGKSTMLEAIAVNYGFNPEGGTPQHFHEHSHGESFLQLAQTNFKGNGVYLLDEPGAELLSFDNGRIHPIEYEDTDSYQITKLFIENREQLLGRLLRE